MAWRLIETRELLGEDGIPGQIKIYDVVTVPWRQRSPYLCIERSKRTF